MRLFQMHILTRWTAAIGILFIAGCRGDHLTSFASGIRSATESSLYEGLPHQMSEAAALEQELASRATVQLSGFPFYQAALTLTDADEKVIREVVYQKGNFSAMGSAVKACGGFHPDYCVEWSDGDGKLYHMLICFGCSEAMLSSPSRSITYDLSKTAYTQLEVILKPYHKNRPDSPLSRAGHLSKSLTAFATGIQNATECRLYEGLPHQKFEKPAMENELATKATVLLGGHPFYQETLTLNKSDERALQRIVCKPETFEAYSGEKKCGGYHPDYCVEWRGSDDSKYRVLICFGCFEAILDGPADSVRYDLEKSAYSRLKEILNPYQKNRPARLADEENQQPLIQKTPVANRCHTLNRESAIEN